MDSTSDENLLARLQTGAQPMRVPFEGGEITWRRFGKGEPLVLLHGGHGSWLHWARNIETLASRFAVWAPDMPGYGDSTPPPGDSLDDLVDALMQTMEEVAGAGPLRLVGFSFGSLVAANVAARRGNVSHLALLGPAGHGGPRRPRGELLAWRGFEPQSQAWHAVMRHNLLMHMVHDASAIDEQALRIHGQSCLGTRFHSKTIARSPAMPALLDRYRGQLLLAWGEHDVTLTPAFAEHVLGEGRLRCRTCTIDGAGHWVQYEAAGAVNRLLLEWLGGAPAD